MARDSFIFYRSYYEAMSGLKDKDKLQLFNAISELSLNENEVKLSGICKNIFTAIKPQIIANSERYENGKKGGRPQKKTIGFEKEKTIGFENEKPNNNENENDENENENVNDNVNVNVNDNANDSCVDGLQQIIDFYNNNIGQLMPYGLTLLEDYLKEMSSDLIIYAMKIAVEADKKTINYIKAILNNWSNKGIKTVIEAEKENKDFKKTKGKKESNFEQREYEDLSYLYANKGE